MKKEENKNLEYLGKVFKELPPERKGDLLHTARQLLKIQGNGDFLMFAEKSVQQKERKRMI